MNETLLRELAPQVLAAVARRHGRFDLAEDATQEALIAAAQQWPVDGVPDHPRGWLIAVATRRLIDALRAEASRSRREETALAQEPPPGADVPDDDDTLTLLFLCCHPALSAPSQLALTLRAIGGLTTAEIAAAFLVPEATMAQRISRAKAAITEAGGRFERPRDDERAERAPRRAAGPLPDVQRGLHGDVGRAASAARARGRGDPPHADDAGAASR